MPWEGPRRWAWPPPARGLRVRRLGGRGLRRLGVGWALGAGLTAWGRRGTHAASPLPVTPGDAAGRPPHLGAPQPLSPAGRPCSSCACGTLVPGRLAWLVWPWRTERCSGQPWGDACWRPLPSAGLSCAPAPQHGHGRGPSPFSSRRAAVGLAPSQCTLPWGLQRGGPRGPRPPCPRPAFAEAPTCSRVSHLSWAAGVPVLGVHQACLAPKLLPGPAQPHPSPRRAQGGARTPQARCSPPGPRAASCALACFYGAMKI